MEDLRLFRAVLGALKSTINDHGAITKEGIMSAAKRISSQICGRVIEFEIQTKSGEGDNLLESRRRYQHIINGRKKSRLALKLLAERAYPQSSIDERHRILNDVTREARIMVNETLRMKQEQKMHSLMQIACRYGEP